MRNASRDRDHACDLLMGVHRTYIKSADSQTRMTDGDMVRDEYPAPEREEREEEMIQEIVEPQENDRDDADDEQMECVQSEEYSNDSGCLVDDVYSSDIGD